MPHIHLLKKNTDLLALHRANPQRYPFLLQSIAHRADVGRFDILFAFPGDVLQLDSLQSDLDFLDALDARWQAESADLDGSQLNNSDLNNSDLNTPDLDKGAIPINEDSLPFSGGWFLFLAYELAGQVEVSLSLPEAVDGLPIAYAARVPAAVIIDHKKQQTFMVAEAGRESLLDDISTDISGISNAVSPPTTLRVLGTITFLEEEANRYLQGVNRIKDYIVEGDVFQVNLSRKWQGECDVSVTPADIYERLCSQNPAPFAGLAVMGEAAVISSSPERLVQTSASGVVNTRPIAGTRPRAASPVDDIALQNELLAHPKERAEHIMLIDLERNDLGRISVPGSVEVNELMVLESYTHVHHIVSNVRGRLRPEVTPGQVIRAVFPGGTITGCPKVRCMEIVAELEQQGRGAYTGAMGYLNLDGSMDLNILIRTITHTEKQISFRAGAGIVADSVADKEIEETRAKARGLLLI